MKKITFNVSTKKDGGIASLIKAANKISCRLQIDLEGCLISVENADDNEIDSVIELVNQYYTILSVNINNISTDDTLANDTAPEIDSVGIDEPIVIEPQIEAQSELIEDLINSLTETANFAISRKNAPDEEVGKYILTAMSGISMRYNPKNLIEYSVGDIVDCYYGLQLIGEINGSHVPSIVCNILGNGMTYVVPIIRESSSALSPSAITFDAKKDVIYRDTFITGNVAILNKGRYFRPERFNSVIGTATPEFLANVLAQLKSTFDFTVSENEVPSMNASTSISNEETALLNLIGTALDKLDSTKNSVKQNISFLTEIGFPTSDPVVTRAFEVACNIEKIKYSTLVSELHNIYPDTCEGKIRAALKQSFKEWLKQHPDLAKECPNIAITSLLKVFAKKFKA